MSDCHTYLCDNLRNLRIACGFTQQTIAQALGVVRSTYTYYETGKTAPDPETLVKLARIFGVSIDQLLLFKVQPGMAPEALRVRHHPSPIPQHIGDLTEEEKVLIARFRSGELPGL